MTKQKKQSPASKPLTHFRGSLARGISADAKIDAAGGMFGGGVIEGYAMICRGEAMGHDLWIDESFVAATSAALSQMTKGAKSRFTHPDLSADGLAKGLGRTVLADSESTDIARGSLHFHQSAHRSPDGDLAGYILERAIEDPDSFGASISFMRDIEQEDKDFEAMGGRIFFDADGWKKYDFEEFKSPDPRNTKGLLHTRMFQLRAVDLVDEGAATDGLFQRDPVFAEATQLFDFAMGLTKDTPTLTAFDIDPERVASFISKRLESQGLVIMSKEELNAATEEEVITQDTSDETENTTEATEAVESTEEATKDETQPEAKEEAREELSRFMAEFGDARGAKWFAEGKSFADSQSEFVSILKKENESLKAKARLDAESEETPLSTGGADASEQSEKKGYVSNIRFAGSPSTN